MSAITINGERVVSGSITIPYYGAWAADAILASSMAIPDEAALVVGDLSLSGKSIRSASFAGSRSARIVGGRAGWRTELPPKGYSHAAGVKLSTVLGDAAREVGERIVVAADRTIGSHWARIGGEKAERVLHLLLDGKWWIAPNGDTRIDARDASPITSPFTVIAWSGGKGLFEIATESIAPWQPGRTFTAPNVAGVQTISSVTIEVDNAGKLRLHVLNTDAATDRLRTDLRAIVRSESPSMSFAGVWEYTIASGDDKTVDVTPSDTRMPSLTNVPMMPGLMGEVVTPAPGSKCRIMFVNSDPSRPECTGIIGTPTKVVIAGGLPTQGAARAGDPVAGTNIGVPTSLKVFIG